MEGSRTLAVGVEAAHTAEVSELALSADECPDAHEGHSQP